jgi:hypothetical protein
VSGIRRSIELNPRIVSIVFFNHDRFEQVVRDESWIEKQFESGNLHGYACGVYRALPASRPAMLLESASSTRAKMKPGARSA